MPRNYDNFNPLSDILQTRRPELAAVISTSSIQYEASATISEYPVESGASIADHTLRRPEGLTIVGYVGETALNGEGPGEVYRELLTMLEEGILLTLNTPRGSWDNCIITKVSSPQTSRNAFALDISVEFSQLLLSEVENTPVPEIIDTNSTNVDEHFFTFFQMYMDMEPSTFDPDLVDELVTQGRLQSYDVAEFIREQLFYFHENELDPEVGSDLSFSDSRDIAVELSGFTSSFYNELQYSGRILPQLTHDMWEIPLTSARLEHNPRNEIPDIRRSLRVKAEVPGPNNTFTIYFTFKYTSLYDVEGVPGNSSEILPFNNSWLMDLRIVRPSRVGPLPLPSREFGPKGVKIAVNSPILIDDSVRPYGYLIFVPRYDVSGDANEVTKLRALRSVDGNPPTLMLVYVRDERAFQWP